MAKVYQGMAAGSILCLQVGRAFLPVVAPLGSPLLAQADVLGGGGSQIGETKLLDMAGVDPLGASVLPGAVVLDRVAAMMGRRPSFTFTSEILAHK